MGNILLSKSSSPNSFSFLCFPSSFLIIYCLNRLRLLAYRHSNLISVLFAVYVSLSASRNLHMHFHVLFLCCIGLHWRLSLCDCIVKKKKKKKKKKTDTSFGKKTEPIETKPTQDTIMIVVNGFGAWPLLT